MNPSPPQPLKHPPLLDLSALPSRALQSLLPVCGPTLERWLAVDHLNAVHDGVVESATEETFFSRTLQILGARYEVSPSDLERIPLTGPVVVVANHPLGGLDGIILGDLLRHRRKDTKLMANFLLKKVMYADKHMFFVDPFAREEAVKANFNGLRDCLKHLKQGGLLGIFPGNRVSHWQWKRRQVCDSDWVPNMAALIRRTEASVVPIFIEGGNSALFNIAGVIHPLLRTLLLPRELKRQAQSKEPVRLNIGTAIPFSRLKRFDKDEDMSAFLRLATYALGNRPDASVPEHLADAVQSQAPAPVAEALSADLLEADIAALPPEAKLMEQGEFHVYIGKYSELPNIMQEIGRGREESFRAAGGGTRKPMDLAPQDAHYRHLFLWHRTDKAVVGAYRLGLSDEILPVHGPQGLICTSLFELKPKFLEQLNPGIELGRSYVLPQYQRNYNSLLLLWAGILQFIAREPRYRMVFGSVGISQGSEYTPASRTLIVNWMREQFSDPLSVEVVSRSPFEGVKLYGMETDEISNLVQSVEDVSTLVTGIEQDGKGVPILIKHYLRMNAKLLSFGVWKSHSDAVVSFILTDLTTSDPKFLKRYMGVEGYEKFMKLHGATEPAATD